MEMILRKGSWWMRPPEMDLFYSGRPQQYQRWKFFLASESKTQGPLSLPALHSGICSHISSSGN